MPDSPPLTIVAGLGRCGTSLTMRMLDEGGHNVCGAPPAYEELDSRSYATDALREALGEWRGSAVKMIDPIGMEYAEALPNTGSCRWIWLAREVKQQARSMMKMLATQGLKVRSEKAYRQSLRRSTKTHWRLIKRRGEDVLKLRFEDLIRRPDSTARRLKDFTGWPLDEQAMTAVIEERDTRAADGFDIELSQL